MARDPKHVHADLLAEAIAQARPLLRWPINRVELKGSLIRVEAQGQPVFFQVNMSHLGQRDEITGRVVQTVGGESYDLVRIAEERRVETETVWRKRRVWWRWFSKTHAINDR